MPMVRVWIREIVGFVGAHLYRLSTRKEDGFGTEFVEMSWFSRNVFYRCDRFRNCTEYDITVIVVVFDGEIACINM